MVTTLGFLSLVLLGSARASTPPTFEAPVLPGTVTCYSGAHSVGVVHLRRALDRDGGAIAEDLVVLDDDGAFRVRHLRTLTVEGSTATGSYTSGEWSVTATLEGEAWAWTSWQAELTPLHPRRGPERECCTLEGAALRCRHEVLSPITREVVATYESELQRVDAASCLETFSTMPPPVGWEPPRGGAE